MVEESIRDVEDEDEDLVIKPIVVPEPVIKKVAPLKRMDGKEPSAQDIIDEANALLAGEKPSIIQVGAQFTKFEVLKRERR